jgi:hypothetical protein
VEITCPGCDPRVRKAFIYRTVSAFLYEVKLKYPTNIISLMVYNEMLMWILDHKVKGKAIPVTGHGGPEGCETSRLPHFLENWLTDGGKVVSLTRRPAGRPAALTLRKFPGSHFYQRRSRPEDQNVAGNIRSIEKSNDLIAIRTRDLAACGIVPQPTTLPRAPTNPTWPDLGSNPGSRGGKPAANRQSYVMASSIELL